MKGVRGTYTSRVCIAGRVEVSVAGGSSADRYRRLHVYTLHHCRVRKHAVQLLLAVKFDVRGIIAIHMRISKQSNSANVLNYTSFRFTI